MKNQDVIDKVKRIKGNTRFENNIKEMDYTIHKFFDAIIHHKDINNKVIVKIEKNSNGVLPFFLDIENYFKKNSKIWTQEYKCHFDVNLSQSTNDYFITFKMDKITKPKKVFVKEFSYEEINNEVKEMKSL